MGASFEQADLGQDSGIDRKSLRALVDRFRTQHLNRLEGHREAVNTAQRLVIDTLPLMLHSGHAALPGYVNASTPTGIDNYRPGPEARRAIRQISLSYTEPRFVKRSNHIQAVFLAGRHSLEQDGSNPHHPMIFAIFCDATKHDALQQKASRLQRWAASLGVILQIDLIDPKAWFQDKGAGGKTPNLDLDEFYSTGLYLAGRFPMWWLILSDHTSSYTEHCQRLLQQRFVRASDFFDLGDVTDIPSCELFNAGLDDLQHALCDPRRYLSKLLLLEAYATEPQVDLLSQQYKTLLNRDLQHRQKRDPGHSRKLGPARILSQHLSDYLSQRDEIHRLELCYATPDANIEQRLEEDRALKGELHNAYQGLKTLALEQPELTGQEQIRTAQALSSLQTCLENLNPDRRGAVPKLLPCLRHSKPAGHLNLIRKKDHWSLQGNHAQVFSAARLACIAAWCMQQGLRLSNLGFSGCPEVSTRTRMARLMDILHSGLASALSVDLNQSDPQFRYLWIFVNTEEEGLDGLTGNGDALLSSRDDAFDFSGFHHNLVQGIDLILLDSLGDVFTEHFSDDHALTDVLARITALLPDPGDEPDLRPGQTEPFEVHSVGLLKRHQIQRRMRQLILDLRSRLTPDSGDRFIFSLGEGSVVCSLTSLSGLETLQLQNEAELFRFLQQPPPAKPGRTIIDDHSPGLARLHRFISLVRFDRATLLIQHAGVALELFLAEENGSIYHYSTGLPSQALDNLAEEIGGFLQGLAWNPEVRPQLYRFQDDEVSRLPFGDVPGPDKSSQPGTALNAYLRKRFNPGHIAESATGS